MAWVGEFHKEKFAKGGTTARFSGSLPSVRLAIVRQDSARFILSSAMKRCILRSTVAGFPANGGFLAAALSAHPSTLAIPTLKGARALAWGLDRFVAFFRISSVHWYNTDCWLTRARRAQAAAPLAGDSILREFLR